MLKKKYSLDKFYFQKLKNELSYYNINKVEIINNYRLLQFSEYDYKLELINLSKDFNVSIKLNPENKTVEFSAVKILHYGFVFCGIIDVFILIVSLNLFYIYSVIVLLLYFIIYFQLCLHAGEVLNRLKIKSI